MAQQAKDLVSGIKKIFPSSRRSGSFSLGRSSSTTEFSAEALALAQEGDETASYDASSAKKKERRTSFSFSGWKERRSSLSASKKKEATSPPQAHAQAEHPSRGDRKSGHSATATPTALARSTSHPGHFSSAAGPLTSHPPALGRATSATVSGQPPPPPPLSAASSRPEVVTRAARSESYVPELPTKSQLSARSSRSSYNSLRGASASNSRTADAENVRVNGTSHSVGNSRSNVGARSSTTTSSSLKTPVAADKARVRAGSSHGATAAPSAAAAAADDKKKRRTSSFSFSSRHKAPSATAVDDVAMIVKKPHAASTWDSDSDDDYEDTRRPRGPARRSVSVDFMEQNPTHLISKIWRKLPIQARLYGGRGSVDLDMQKDRNSFSRSSTAKQQAEKLGQSNYNRPPSPLPNANMFGDKHIYFSQQIGYCTDGTSSSSSSGGGYVALESYDDVLVRVCRFAAHDQRRTATKVQEFLERSMAFLHGTRTKHGNVVSISNEEIRMWRRLARHDWALEEVTDAAALPDGAAKQLAAAARKKESRSSSAATTECDSDSDEQRRRKADDDDDDDDDDDENAAPAAPTGGNLRALLAVVNCCVGFGEYLFSFEEVDELVRLEFLVEEDGWI
ncbi:hypothetical protein PybrP1_006006 [[Pythium] brassicae (nom. inval.)]|nr:hypothetical protein PybrP1_006006 [[Pythium] brassicae (nom. inval.)]